MDTFSEWFVASQLHLFRSRVRLPRLNFPWRCAADFLEAREVPAIGEVAALLRLHGLNGAVAAFEENTFAIWFLLQGKTMPVGTQASVSLDEIEFAHAEKCREARNLRVAQTPLSRPAAALGAAHALVMNRHGETIAARCPFQNRYVIAARTR